MTPRCSAGRQVRKSGLRAAYNKFYPADLDAWEKKAGVKVGPGDIVFVRTGRRARRAEKGPWNTEIAAAGMHASCARWFH